MFPAIGPALRALTMDLICGGRFAICRSIDRALVIAYPIRAGRANPDRRFFLPDSHGLCNYYRLLF